MSASRRQRLLHLDLKTVNSYGDQLLFELVRQTFNSFGGGGYFDVTESHPFRERATEAWVDQVNENFDGVVIGGGGSSRAGSTPRPPRAGSGTSPSYSPG